MKKSFILLLIGVLGCRPVERPSAPAAQPAQPRAAVPLRVLVVNERPLAEGIQRLRGEWSVRSGGQLEAATATWHEVASATQLDADVVVFPARYLGELCERGWLRPIRASVLQGKMYDAEDVFPVVRRRLIRYGGQDMALPLGVQVPLVGYRQSWLARRQGEPPRTWAEFHELVKQPDAAPLWWPPRESIEHWHATMLLARAAAYAVHANREGELFDPQTMSPRIAEPPFVRALDEWQREMEVVGQTGADISGEDTIIWTQPPGSDQLFDPVTGRWETAEGGVRQVPVLSGGTLAGVTAASHNAASAFELLAWLTSSEIGSQVGPKAAASLPCRHSQLPTINQWLGNSGGRTEATRLAGVAERTLGGNACLAISSLPGIDEYLAALDDGVKRALGGELPPAEALGRVAQQWDDITNALGRDAQRRAYANYLGISDQ